MVKKKLLLCFPDCPFPVRRNGFSIRWAPLLKHFSQYFDIDILIISPVGIAAEDLAECSKYSSNVSCYVKKNTKVSLIEKFMRRFVSFIPGATPFDFVYYHQSELDDFFCKNFSKTHYNLAVVVSKTCVRMVQRFASYDKLTLDVIDSSYALKLREAKSWIDYIDAWLIKYWEKKTLAYVDCASFISSVDRELTCDKSFDPQKVWVIPNGVYLGDSDNTHREDFGAPTIGFLGNMSYGPNILAAKRLYGLFKNIQKEMPNLKLVIVGRDPVPEIQSLSEDPSAIVTGTVDNIWPYVNGIDLFVFGMQIGSGQQNKLLDAMAAKKPVVTTNLGNGGVNAIDGVSVVIANSDQEFECAIVELMASPEKRKRIGEQGYKFAIETYSWVGIFQQFEQSLFYPIN